MSFHVGQKVVCIRPTLICKCLVKNRVYTCLGYDVGGWAIVDCCSGHPGLGWVPNRFRPLVERKTDISIFTAMLDGVKQGEPA